MDPLCHRLDSDGRRIRDTDVRRGMRLNIAAGSLGMAWVAVGFNMPFTMLMEALGAGGLLIGLVSTMRQGSMLMQIPGSLYAERLPARKRFWVGLNVTQRLLWLLVGLALLRVPGPSRGVAWALLGVVGVSTVLAQLSAGTWHSWMAELVPDHVRGRFWGRRQAVTMAAYLVATGVAGYVLDRFSGTAGAGRTYRGFALVFAAAASLGVVDILLHLRIPEPKPRQIVPGTGLLARVAAPLKRADFRSFSLGMGVWFLAISMAGTFGVVYLKRTFAVEYTHLSLLAIAGSVSTILGSFVWGYLIDRIGARALCLLLMAAAPLFGLFWFFCGPAVYTWTLPWVGAVRVPQPIVLLTVSSLLAGSLFGGVSLCQMSLLGALAPNEGRSTAMAVHWTIVGVLGAMGPLVAGLIVDGFPARMSPVWLPAAGGWGFIHVLIILRAVLVWGASIPLLLRIRPHPHELPVGSALARVMMMNPVRIASSINNIRIMTSAATHGRRARAAWALGRQKTAIAVSDLIERLDDPAADVREAAAFALGRIGSGDAVDALIGKLDDPNCDLAPQIARALREARDPRSVKALMRKLDVPDRETQRETARTLGAIGDRRASPSLFNLLRTTGDDAIVSASSEALSHLGELAAIHEIVPRMLATGNPVLRRSLAVAVGDLLGCHDEFYQVLTAEEAARGSAVASLLKELRRAVRRLARERMRSEGRKLTAKLREIEAAHQDERHADCADLMYRLALGLAALSYGVQFGGDAEAMGDELIWHDERFAVGVWYLGLLRDSFDPAGRPARASHVDHSADVLLGIYFLSRWSRSVQARLAA
ncbi:MAG: MFS transporter [Kiritimatiellae bacterium]|nr:MFS transporter [Kiritimatiellia bacterium]